MLKPTRVIVGSLYSHYKRHDLYKVVGVATHTETGEKLVIYQAQYGDMKVWARPETMFCETVNVNGTTVNRFQLLKDVKDGDKNGRKKKVK